MLRDGDVPWFASAARTMRFVRALDDYLEARKRKAPAATTSGRSLATAGAALRAAIELGATTLGEAQAKPIRPRSAPGGARDARGSCRGAGRRVDRIPVALMASTRRSRTRPRPDWFTCACRTPDVAAAYDALSGRRRVGERRVGGERARAEWRPRRRNLPWMRRDPQFGPMMMVGWRRVRRDPARRRACARRRSRMLMRAMIAETRRRFCPARGTRPLDPISSPR
jgi:hypothetical protein